MRGTLFGLVREVLERQYGTGLWDSLLAACELNGKANPFDGTASSSAGEVARDLPSDALVCWFGRDVVPQLSKMYPSLFGRHDNLRSFVRSLGEGLPTAEASIEVDQVAALECRESFDGDALVTIRGPEPVCALVEGVIAGAADLYGEPVVVDELKCAKRGDACCVLQITFAPQVVDAEWGRKDSGFAVIGSA